jgi:hypothetical protein
VTAQTRSAFLARNDRIPEQVKHPWNSRCAKFQKVPMGDKIACGIFSSNEIDDGYFLVCVKCERPMRTFAFRLGLTVDFRAYSA